MKLVQLMRGLFGSLGWRPLQVTGEVGRWRAKCLADGRASYDVGSVTSLGTRCLTLIASSFNHPGSTNLIPRTTAKMIPSTSLLRTARVVFPSIRQCTAQCARNTTNSAAATRAFSALSLTSTRPNILAKAAVKGQIGKEMQKAVVGSALGQVRGMKVRSSVKKLCEGCKVCFAIGFLLVVWGLENSGLDMVREAIVFYGKTRHLGSLGREERMRTKHCVLSSKDWDWN